MLKDPSGGDGGGGIACGLARVSPVADPRDDVKADHLVVMVNGINGSCADWSYGAEKFEELGDKILVRCSKCNPAASTFDGVDIMGARLAKEVETVVSENPSLKKISFVAHSLGGLVARYAIGKLYSTGSDGGGRIARLEPVNFITVATPHLGSKGNKQLPFLCGVPFLERTASQAAHLIVGKSGKHLFLTDKDNDSDEPLLLRMVQDTGDLKFMSALSVFKRRVAYANANSDHMVGWRTSSIRRQNELPKPNCLVSNDKYPHIVCVQKDTVHAEKDPNAGAIDESKDIEETMISGLNQVDWERVDVSFQNSRLRYLAHYTIQVKRQWLKYDGADVVKHITDHFLL